MAAGAFAMSVTFADVGGADSLGCLRQALISRLRQALIYSATFGRR